MQSSLALLKYYELYLLKNKRRFYGLKNKKKFYLKLESNPVKVNDNGEVDISLDLYTELLFDLGDNSCLTDIQEQLGKINFSVTIGRFTGLNADGKMVDLSSVTGGNGQIYDSLRVTPTPVPEPAVMMLFGLSLSGLAAINRRKS